MTVCRRGTAEAEDTGPTSNALPPGLALALGSCSMFTVFLPVRHKTTTAFLFKDGGGGGEETDVLVCTFPRLYIHTCRAEVVYYDEEKLNILKFKKLKVERVCHWLLK